MLAIVGANISVSSFKSHIDKGSRWQDFDEDLDMISMSSSTVTCSKEINVSVEWNKIMKVIYIVSWILQEMHAYPTMMTVHCTSIIFSCNMHVILYANKVWAAIYLLPKGGECNMDNMIGGTTTMLLWNKCWLYKLANTEKCKQMSWEIINMEMF
jgi:hypothetical protein